MIWSDLHLADRNDLFGFGPPFGDVDRMNRHLLRQWRSRVRSDDTIICPGDVAPADAWRDRHLVLDIQNCPGDRVLILRNHDLDREALREAGFTTQYSLALCATDPPVVLSHYPLHQLPVGAMKSTDTCTTSSSRPPGTSIWRSKGPTTLRRPRLGPGQSAAAARHVQTEPGHGQVVREGVRRALHEVDLGCAQERQNG